MDIQLFDPRQKGGPDGSFWRSSSSVHSGLPHVHGTDLTEYGTDLTECGTDVTECGTDFTECGTDVSECGTDFTECGTDVTECAAILMLFHLRDATSTTQAS